MSTHVSHEAVNTTSELDFNFQLEALSQSFIDWETKLMGYEERSLLKTENCLNDENECWRRQIRVRRKVKT